MRFFALDAMVSKQSKVSKENAVRLAPQITLAARRIRAFELALRLIDRELS